MPLFAILCIGCESASLPECDESKLLSRARCAEPPDCGSGPAAPVSDAQTVAVDANRSYANFFDGDDFRGQAGLGGRIQVRGGFCAGPCDTELVSFVLSGTRLHDGDQLAIELLSLNALKGSSDADGVLLTPPGTLGMAARESTRGTCLARYENMDPLAAGFDATNLFASISFTLADAHGGLAYVLVEGTPSPL